MKYIFVTALLIGGQLTLAQAQDVSNLNYDISKKSCGLRANWKTGIVDLCGVLDEDKDTDPKDQRYQNLPAPELEKQGNPFARKTKGGTEIAIDPANFGGNIKIPLGRKKNK